MTINDSERIAGWAKELSDVEDQIGAEQEKLRAQLADGRSRVQQLRERAKHLLALISGRENEQLPLLDAAPPADADGEPRPKAPPKGYRWVQLGARGLHVAASVGAKKTECDEPIKWRGKQGGEVWLPEGEAPVSQRDRDMTCVDCTAWVAQALEQVASPQPRTRRAARAG